MAWRGPSFCYREILLLLTGMELSVIIPAYNEEKRLASSLKVTLDFLKSKKDYEVIVVNDGSKDDTAKIASKFDIKLVSYEENRGKGYAIKRGIEEAKGRYILFLDADNATPISEMDKLLPKLKEYDIAIGSRYLPNSLIERKQPWYRVMIGRMGNMVIRLLLIRGINDTQCGFKAFRKEAAKELFAKLQTYRFGFDIEVLARARKKKYKIIEVPVSWHHTENSQVRFLRDSYKTLMDLFRIWWILR